MIKSSILDCKNKCFGFFQNKFEKITENSVILSNIDSLIFLFISLTLAASTFMQSEKIGAFAIIVVLLYVIKLFTHKGSTFEMTKWDGAIFVYFAICFISTINSTLLPQSIHGFLKTVIYLFYYFAAVNYFRTNTCKIQYVMLLVSGLCCFEGIIALIQNFGGVEQIATWQDSNYINPEDAIARAYGTLKPYNPNLLGGYLIAGIPYAIGACGLYIVEKKFKAPEFWLTLTAFLTCSLGVFVTGSRGAYLGLGAIAAGFVLIAAKIIWTDFGDSVKLKSIWKKAVISLASAVVLLMIAVPKILKRLLSIFILRGDSSTSFRMNVYNSSWQMFCDNWILGIGAGNQTFREIYGLYMLTGYDALSTYSVPLEIAVESGILGLIAYVAFLGLFIFAAYKFISDTNRLTEKVIASAAILTILGVMMHGMFDTIYFRPQLQFLYWTMIAMASAVIVNRNNKRNSEVDE